MLGQVAASQIRVPAAKCRQLAELRALVPPVPKIRRSRTHIVFVLLGHGFPDRDYAIQMREGKRPQQHGVNRIEDGCIGPDTQRQSNHRDRGEAGTLPQGTQPVTKILQQTSHYLSLNSSLVAQRHHGIHFRGPARWNVAGRQGHQNDQCCNAQECDRVGRGYAE